MRSRCQQGPAPSDTPREVLASGGGRGPSAFLACGYIIPVSASVFTRPLSPCVCVSTGPSKDTSYWIHSSS